MVAGMDTPTIACFGLAYKRDVGDLRESPAVEVTRLLAGLRLGPVLAVEPHVGALPACLDGVELTSSADALSRADLAVLLVDHQEFRGIPASALATTAILDTRGVWSPPSREAVAPVQSIPAALPLAGRDREPAIARTA
jgi:UDP-N-acetyl-D-mannosaminuronic acid dehydrogenase